jgi:O-antigen/teichoic acid export membrane protein
MLPEDDGAEIAQSDTASLRGHLVRGTFGSLGLTVVNAGLTFLNGILLARLLGAESYGVYSTATSLMLLISLPVILGFDRLVVRELPATVVRGEWAAARALVRRAFQSVMLTSVLVSLAVGLVIWLLRDRIGEEIAIVFLAALLLVPFQSFNVLRRSVGLGLQQIVAAQLPESLIRPAVFSILLFVALLGVGMISALAAMILSLLALLVSTTIGILVIFRRVPNELRAGPVEYRTRFWLREALPFAMLGAVQVFLGQIDVLMVGTIAGAEAAGHFAVAARGAGLVIFGFLAVNVTLGPTIARLWAAHDTRRLQLAITRGARGAFAFALVIALMLWAFGPQFLSLFGPEFVTAEPILVTLVMSALIDVALGLGPVSLAMTGHQRTGFIAIAATASVRVVFGLILIPTYGALGAAFGALISVVVYNSVTVTYARLRLRVDVTPLGFRPPHLSRGS